jgi:hypothetical protein
MNKLLGSLSLVALTCLSPLAFAGGDACVGNTCYFPSLINSDKQSTFYCDVTRDVSEVRLANHNVIVKGFREIEPGSGTLTLKGRHVKYLKDYYFVVTNDFSHTSLAKTVVVEQPTDGSVVCHAGMGGRKSPWS